MLKTEDEPLASVALRVAERGQVTPRDVQKMRRDLYSDGFINRIEAQALLTLEHAIRKRHPSWDEFYVEALTDYFMQNRDELILGDDELAFLKAGIMENGKPADPTELRLLLNLVFHAKSCPAPLIEFTREALLHSIKTSSVAIFGEGGRTAGSVDEQDVQALRRLVYGRGGSDGLQVSEDEALWLMSIDHATHDAVHHPGWRQLFVKAEAMYLLFAGASPECIDPAEVNWLERHLPCNGILTPNGRALLAYLRAEATRIHPSFEVFGRMSA
ncbi:MAG: hypothetical protein KDG54_06585 [Geminicoccaceae bacterium]|nr:hypothetical protein [Geminicoccaceae bacterium]